MICAYCGKEAKGTKEHWNWLEWDERILEEIDTSMERKRYIREKTSEERRRRRAKKAAESEAYWNKIL